MTKTLSVRVPIEVAERVENLCIQRGIKRNQLLQDLIASDGVIGVNNFSNNSNLTTTPEIVKDILTGLGGLTTGTTVYHLLNNNLPETWDNDTKEFVSVISAIASGLAMAYGLHKIIKK
jgi:hypothetical protein